MLDRALTGVGSFENVYTRLDVSNKHEALALGLIRYSVINILLELIVDLYEIYCHISNLVYNLPPFFGRINNVLFAGRKVLSDEWSGDSVQFRASNEKARRKQSFIDGFLGFCEIGDRRPHVAGIGNSTSHGD